MANFPTVTDYIRPKDPVNDKYGTHHENFGIGGSRNTMTIAAMHAIPVEKRRRQMIVSVYSDGGSPALYWLLSPDNTVNNLANNTYWTKILLGTSFPSGITFKGQFSAVTKLTQDGVLIQDSPLSPVGSLNGWFYVCSAAGTANFGSGNQTFNIGDWVIFDGTSWRLLVQVSALQWNLITGIPNIILDIASGALIVATQSEIQSLQDQINALNSTVNIISDINGAPTDAIANVGALVNYFYSKTEVDSLIAGLSGGGGSGIIFYDDLANGAQIFAGKYYGFNDKIYRCTGDHIKDDLTGFNYVLFKYQNRIDLVKYTWYATGAQLGVTNPIFTIPNASPGEIHVLQLLAVKEDEKNVDPNYTGKIWDIITVGETDDSIQLTLDIGSELIEGDVVSVQYYRDEAQVNNEDTLLLKHTFTAIAGQTDFVLPSGRIKNVNLLLLDSAPLWEEGTSYTIETTDSTDDTIRIYPAVGEELIGGEQLYVQYFSNVGEILIDIKEKVNQSWADAESGNTIVGKTTDSIIEIIGSFRSVDKTLVTKVELSIRIINSPLSATLIQKDMTPYVAEFENIFTGASIIGTDVQLDYNVGALGQGVVLNGVINQY